MALEAPIVKDFVVTLSCDAVDGADSEAAPKKRRRRRRRKKAGQPVPRGRIRRDAGIKSERNGPVPFRSFLYRIKLVR